MMVWFEVFFRSCCSESHLIGQWFFKTAFDDMLFNMHLCSTIICWTFRFFLINLCYLWKLLSGGFWGKRKGGDGGSVTFLWMFKQRKLVGEFSPSSYGLLSQSRGHGPSPPLEVCQLRVWVTYPISSSSLPYPKVALFFLAFPYATDFCD